MTKLEISYQDIRTLKEFKKYGDTFKQVEDFGDNIFLYSRENEDSKGVYVFELVRGVPLKNPDGSIVYTYPSSSEWGRYGFTFIRPEGRTFEKVLRDLLNDTEGKE